MKISVIGAGAQGSAIASVLSKYPEVSKVVSADINLNAARQVVKKTKSDKVSAERVDAGACMHASALRRRNRSARMLTG